MLISILTSNIKSGIYKRHKNIFERLNQILILQNENLKPIEVALGGEDGGVKFYDTRSLQKPVKKLRNIHTHWTWGVKYNPIHDQLFLSAGGDGRVFLHSITSIRLVKFSNHR